MISIEYVQLLARYNAWQNASLYREAGRLSDGERKANRGAFFGSIHGTLCHLLFGDQTWLHRFTDGRTTKPRARTIAESVTAIPDWADLVTERLAVDREIEVWAGALEPRWLEGDLTWFSGAIGREVTRPRWQLATHFFNHQIHHRGQVHAMLTACGAKPDDTDLPFMPT